MVILVNTIYRIRESLQWDQEKMADEMKVTVATVKRWENEDGIPEFPIVKDTTPNMMNPRLYITNYNKTQGQQFDRGVLALFEIQQVEKIVKG